MRLICHRFQSNEVRPCLSVIAYNQGNLWRRLVLPKRIGHWSLSSLQQWLVKTGGRLIKHARYYWLLSRRTSESEAVRWHAENDRGVAAAGRLANQGRKQTSAWKPSSGEVSAARKSGTGKARTTASQNGQNEPHYHAQEARATCG
jgi:hypothetical protein